MHIPDAVLDTKVALATGVIAAGGLAYGLRTLRGQLGDRTTVLMGSMAAFYPWVKAVHIIAVIAWMAGMLYLPRLFVYHCRAEKGSVQSETFKVMERRLIGAIINPAMIATWVLGLTLG